MYTYGSGVTELSRRLKTRHLAPRISDSVDVWWGLRICILTTVQVLLTVWAPPRENHCPVDAWDSSIPAESGGIAQVEWRGQDATQQVPRLLVTGNVLYAHNRPSDAWLLLEMCILIVAHHCLPSYLHLLSLQLGLGGVHRVHARGH